MEKEFGGIGITPFDPYHNSSFVISGELLKSTKDLYSLGKDKQVKNKDNSEK